MEKAMVFDTKKVVLLAFVLVLLSMSMLGTRLVITVNASTTHDVYPGQSIQEAINSAQSGDTILVHSGTYYEHVVVNKPLKLIGEDKKNTIIDGNDAGTVIYVTANNVNVTSFTIRNGGFTYSGIKLESSTGCTIFGNNITNGRRNGIWLYQSSCNTINGNTLTSSERGIRLESYSSDNYISGNNITNNVYGIGVYDYSESNIISGNTITANSDRGIELGTYSKGNTISGNIIANSYIGISLGWASGNIIYHNNLMNNTDQVWSIWGWPNTWDDGYPSGGNYWSNYNGTDADQDGIGDISYTIDANNTDNYPLMNPWTPEEEVPEEKAPFWTQWWLWAIIALVIVALAGAVYFLKKRKPPTPTAPPLPTEGALQNTT